MTDLSLTETVGHVPYCVGEGGTQPVTEERTGGRGVRITQVSGSSGGPDHLKGFRDRNGDAYTGVPVPRRTEPTPDTDSRDDGERRLLSGQDGVTGKGGGTERTEVPLTESKRPSRKTCRVGACGR